jgi:hypothetical protein
MIETLVLYPTIGFVTTFMALEIAWHFTACRIKNKSVKPSLFRQAGLVK